MAQTQSAYKNILGTEAELVNQSPVEEEHSDQNVQLMSKPCEGTIGLFHLHSR